MSKVVELVGVSGAHAPRSVRLFGWPAYVCEASDDNGPSLGGPHVSPDDWLWVVYARPSLNRRRQALGLVDAAVLAAWIERAHARGTFDSYLGVRTLGGYFLIAQDAAGPYITGYSWLFTFELRPSQPRRLVYRQLVRGARWLRQRANEPGAVADGRAAAVLPMQHR